MMLLMMTVMMTKKLMMMTMGRASERADDPLWCNVESGFLGERGWEDVG